MYSAYKLKKQGDNIQPWRTPFPIWNQSVVPCSVLTVASWPAYKFLNRQIRWSGMPISLLTWMTWVWVNSRSWWWTGRPGVLQFMGLQRVRHDWATELNWTDSLQDWGWGTSAIRPCGRCWNRTFMLKSVWLPPPSPPLPWVPWQKPHPLGITLISRAPSLWEGSGGEKSSLGCVISAAPTMSAPEQDLTLVL